MNFRLLVSILIANSFALSAMETALSEENELVSQQVQRLQKPQLKSKVEGYLSLSPQPMEMEWRTFKYIRKVCIKPKYAPILLTLLREKNGVRIIDPNSKHETGSGRVFRLLSEAVFNRAHPNIQILLGAGADPNLLGSNAEEHYSFQESPLFTAVDYLDLSSLRLLLNVGADPNKHDEVYDNLPLVRAVQNYGEADDKDRDIVKTTSVISLLLSYKANPDEKESIGNYNLKDKDDLKKYYTARELAEAYKEQEILALFNKKNETP